MDASEALGGQVVNQAKRIFHVAAWKIRLVFDDLTTVLHEPDLGMLNIVNRDLEDRSKSGPLSIKRLICRPCKAFRPISSASKRREQP
jgi:hypothetical protein